MADSLDKIMSEKSSPISRPGTSSQSSKQHSTSDVLDAREFSGYDNFQEFNYFQHSRSRQHREQKSDRVIDEGLDDDILDILHHQSKFIFDYVEARNEMTAKNKHIVGSPSELSHTDMHNITSKSLFTDGDHAPIESSTKQGYGNSGDYSNSHRRHSSRKDVEVMLSSGISNNRSSQNSNVMEPEVIRNVDDYEHIRLPSKGLGSNSSKFDDDDDDDDDDDNSIKSDQVDSMVRMDSMEEQSRRSQDNPNRVNSDNNTNKQQAEKSMSDFDFSEFERFVNGEHISVGRMLLVDDDEDDED